MTMTSPLRTAGLALLILGSLISTSIPAQSREARDPLSAWTAEFHTGALWSVGDNASPLNYTLLPQLLVVKTPAHWHFDPFGIPLVVRSRFAFEGTPVIEGPESYFVGLTFAPSLEWWNAARTFSTFLSAGGGFGWMDAQGQTISGGQGQDFNVTWFVHAGLAWQLSDRLSASLGARFQHISNGGRNDINPGLDALGPTVSLGWAW